jgi:hypothetical protein
MANSQHLTVQECNVLLPWQGHEVWTKLSLLVILDTGYIFVFLCVLCGSSEAGERQVNAVRCELTTAFIPG